MQEERDVGIVQKTEHKITKYHITLDTYFEEEKDYREAIQTIKNAGQNDVIYLDINSGGGSLYVALAFYDALKSCLATTYANIVRAYSAAVIVALCCDHIIVNDLSTMMVHSIQTAANYKSHAKQKQRSEFYDSFFDNVQDIIYKGFLTDKEMAQITNDEKDLWMNSEEIKKRAVRWAKTKAKLQQQSRQQSQQQ